MTNVNLTNPLPFQLTYFGDLSASSGTVAINSGTITWSGAITRAEKIVIHYDALVDPSITGAFLLTNPMQIDDGEGNTIDKTAYTFVNGLGTYLPLIKNEKQGRTAVRPCKTIIMIILRLRVGKTAPPTHRNPVLFCLPGHKIRCCRALHGKG